MELLVRLALWELVVMGTQGTLEVVEGDITEAAEVAIGLVVVEDLHTVIYPFVLLLCIQLLVFTAMAALRYHTSNQSRHRILFSHQHLFP